MHYLVKEKSKRLEGACIMLSMPQKPSFTLQNIGVDETIGQRISRLRKSQGLTQEEIAGKIGITQSLYSAYERGRLKLSAEMVAQVAHALEITSDEILGLSSPKEKISLDLRLLKRLKKIEALPIHKRRALISSIDMFLKGATGEGKDGPAAAEIGI